MILIKSLLKKKGLLFYNNRMVALSARGILTYFDPKNQSQVKGFIDLNSNQVIVKFTGKQKDHLEIITKDNIFIFKVSFNLFISQIGVTKRQKCDEKMG
jgi:hypothetical protein